MGKLHAFSTKYHLPSTTYPILQISNIVAIITPEFTLIGIAIYFECVQNRYLLISTLQREHAEFNLLNSRWYMVVGR